jgi:hypothetical protein
VALDEVALRTGGKRGEGGGISAEADLHGADTLNDLRCEAHGQNAADSPNGDRMETVRAVAAGDLGEPPAKSACFALRRGSL